MTPKKTNKRGRFWRKGSTICHFLFLDPWQRTTTLYNNVDHTLFGRKKKKEETSSATSRQTSWLGTRGAMMAPYDGRLICVRLPDELLLTPSTRNTSAPFLKSFPLFKFYFSVFLGMLAGCLDIKKTSSLSGHKDGCCPPIGHSDTPAQGGASPSPWKLLTWLHIKWKEKKSRWVWSSGFLSISFYRGGGRRRGCR